MVATIRQLRASTKEILSAAERGETIWITNHGKTCAKITGIHEKKSIKNHPAFGMLRNDPHTADVDAYIRKIRKSRYAL